MPFFTWASLPSALHEKRLCLYLGQCLVDAGALEMGCVAPSLEEEVMTFCMFLVTS